MQDECLKDKPRIDAEKEINWSSSRAFLECLVESLVAWVSRAPNLILQRLVHVVLRV